MVNYIKLSIVLGLILFCGSCKKENTVLSAQIIKESIVSIRDHSISLTYEISALGYNKSGVKYYKKENPQEVKIIEAVRKDGVFFVLIDQLDPESTYVIRPFAEYDNQTIVAENSKEVTTTALFPSEFSLKWSNTDVTYDEFGKYKTTVEGKNLNNINLHDLAILLGGDTLLLDYPKLVEQDNYQITATGNFSLPAGNYMMRVLYKGEEVMGQAIDFSYKGNALTLQLKATHLRNLNPFVINDKIYYFTNNVVSILDMETSSMSKIADIPIELGYMSPNYLTLENKIIFQAQPVTHNLPVEAPDPFNGYELLSRSFDVKNTKFATHFFSKPQKKESHEYESICLFEHNKNIYQAYTRIDKISHTKNNTTNEVVKYNNKTESFEYLTTFDNNFRNYQFISVSGKLYAFGQTNVLDQGFYVGSTFVIYTVDPTNFKLTEQYRYGNKNETYPYSPAGLLNYNNNILVSMGLNNFMLYEIKTNTLKPVVLPKTVPHEYYGGMFIYKNKHYLNANLQFTDGTIYEMSIQ